MKENFDTRMMRHKIRDTMYLLVIICSRGGTIYGIDSKKYEWSLNDLLNMKFIEEVIDEPGHEGKIGYTGTMAGQTVYATMAGVLSSHIGIAAAKEGNNSWLEDVQTK